MEDLLELAEYGCEIAKKEGAEFVDAVAHRGRNISVGIERNFIKHGNVSTYSGMSIRAFVKGGMGFASISGLKKEEILNLAKKASVLAKNAQPDPDFVALPSPPESYPVVEGLFDEGIQGIDAGKLVEYLRRIIEEARSVNRDVVVNGGTGLHYSETAIVNSAGIHAGMRSSVIHISASATIRMGDEVGTFFDFDNARRLSDFNPAGIGVNATRMAMKFLGARHIRGGIMPVIFGPLSGLNIFRTLCYNANAEDIQRNRSYLLGKKGEQIASEVVTIVDDPLIPGGMNSSPYDGEGFPHTKLTVVERGVLKTWLHNSYTANKGKEKNTGHSTRGGISPTNVIVVPGRKTERELISEIKDGIYVAMGDISPNRITGDISATIDWGFKIENGEIAYPVKNVMIGMHMLDFLKNIDAVSSDYREEPGAIMPAVRVQNVKIAGGA